MRARCVGYLGFSGGQLPLRDPGLVRPSLLEATGLISSGAIEVHVTSVFPLEQAAAAWGAETSVGDCKNNNGVTPGTRRTDVPSEEGTP
jgi:hypothetical protein